MFTIEDTLPLWSFCFFLMAPGSYLLRSTCFVRCGDDAPATSVPRYTTSCSQCTDDSRRSSRAHIEPHSTSFVACSVLGSRGTTATQICKSSTSACLVAVVFTLNRSFYPTTTAVHPVSFLILHSREIPGTNSVVSEREKPNAKESR